MSFSYTYVQLEYQPQKKAKANPRQHPIRSHVTVSVLSGLHDTHMINACKCIFVCVCVCVWVSPHSDYSFCAHINLLGCSFAFHVGHFHNHCLSKGDSTHDRRKGAEIGHPKMMVEGKRNCDLNAQTVQVDKSLTRRVQKRHSRFLDFVFGIGQACEQGSDLYNQIYHLVSS